MCKSCTQNTYCTNNAEQSEVATVHTFEEHICSIALYAGACTCTYARDIRCTSMHRNHSMFTMRYIESIRCFEKLWIMLFIDVFS